MITVNGVKDLAGDITVSSTPRDSEPDAIPSFCASTESTLPLSLLTEFVSRLVDHSASEAFRERVTNKV